MKNSIAIVVSALFALVVAITVIVCIERVEVGNVGVVYSMNGVEDEVLTQGWHFVPPLKRVKQFPISQQQIVFSNNPGDYNLGKAVVNMVNAIRPEIECISRAICEGVAAFMAVMREVRE